MCHNLSRRVGVFVILSLLLSQVFLIDSSRAHLALIRQHPVESAGVPNSGDRYGEACCAGDFNGDGFDDLVVGAPYEDVGFQNNEWEGVVTIHLGSPFGLQHTGALQLGQAPPGDPFVQFGKALASGNFNGDAYDDLAVGAPFADIGGQADAGAVYVYMGSASGLDLGSVVQWTQEDLTGLSTAGDFFGWSLVTGDFDANGVDDLAIGGIGENNEAGVVYVAYGVQDVGLSGADADIFTQSSLGDSDGAGDWFGYALAAGPMVHDTETDDLAIGAPYDRQSDPSRTGRVYIVAGLVNSGLTFTGARHFNPDSLGFASQHNERFGWSLSVGQFWGTEGAFQGLAVGGPGYAVNGNADAGRVIVFRPGMDDPAVQLRQDTAGGGAVPDEGDQFGWALASAKIDGDVTDELFVGSPYEQGLYMGIPQDNGLVTLFSGSVAAFPVQDESFSMDAVYLFDRNDRALEMGYSFCVGRFDQWGQHNVVIGSPMATYETWVTPPPPGSPDPAYAAGQVHIYAPHRQIFNTRARSATAHDCADNLVFSIRPFDPLQIASTTKAMTAWIASNHIEWNVIDSLDTYTLSDEYIPDCVSGSQADLVQGETLTLQDLLQLAISESANDACYAIADLITGSSWEWPNNCGDLGKQVTAFVDSMNQRAIDIGMPFTTFTNPAGRPMVNADGVYPHSTAFGMARLGRESLRSLYFRRLVRRTDWTVTSDIDATPDGSNGWLKTMKSKVKGMDINGIKPGSNDPSKQTRVVSGRAASQSNEVIATIFGVESSTIANNVVAELCTLAVSLCPEPTPADLDVLPDPGFDPLFDVDSIPTARPSRVKAIAELDPLEDENKFVVDIFREEVVTLLTSCEMSVNVAVDYALLPGETVTIGAAPFESQDGIRIFNNETAVATLLIAHNQPPGTSFPLTLTPDEDSLVVGPTSVPQTEFILSITNTSSTDTASFSIDELGYKYALTLGDGLVAPRGFSVCVTHTGYPVYGNVVARVIGTDVNAGNTVGLVARHPLIFTGFVDHPLGRGMDWSAIASDVVSYPNPFNPQTTIAYELHAPAAVELDVYDVMGRHVRRLERVPLKAAGAYRITWDAKSASGGAVASGVYFVRLRVGREVRISRVVLLK